MAENLDVLATAVSLLVRATLPAHEQNITSACPVRLLLRCPGSVPPNPALRYSVIIPKIHVLQGKRQTARRPNPALSFHILKANPQLRPRLRQSSRASSSTADLLLHAVKEH
jgi:hypothetical protein